MTSTFNGSRDSRHKKTFSTSFIPKIFNSCSLNIQNDPGNEVCSKCNESFKKLQLQLSTSQKAIESYKYLIQFKDLALKSRENMLKNLIEENKNLKESTKNVQNKPPQSLYSALSPKLSKSKTTFIHAENQSPSMEITSQTFLKSGTLKTLKDQLKRNQGKISKGLFTTSRNFIKTQNSNVVTVTESQGLFDDKSIFTNKEGRVNLLQTDEEAHFSKNKNFRRLEEIIFNEDFLKQFSQFSLEEKFEFQDLVRSFIKDFHRMIKLNQNLKMILKTSLTMNETLNLERNIRNIASGTSKILECHSARILIVDENHKEFWTKNIKGQRERIRFGKGFLSSTMTIGKVLKIDDWSSSQHYEIDNLHSNVKNLICSPILDSKGNVIAILEAINKHKGIFTTDDLNLMTVMCPIIGISLKNSLVYDNLTLTQNKFKKFAAVFNYLMKLKLIFLKLGVELFNSSTLVGFYRHCQEQLKTIMASQLCQFLEYDNASRSLTRLDPDGNCLIPGQELTGIIEICINKRQSIEVSEPSKFTEYNQSLDLVTDLALLTVPIIDHKSQNVIAVFQVVNLVNNVERSYEKIDWIDKEVIEFICVIIEKCLKRFK